MNPKAAVAVAFVLVHLVWAAFLTFIAITIHFAYGQMYGSMYPSNTLPCAALYGGYLWHPAVVTTFVLLAFAVSIRLKRVSHYGVWVCLVLGELMWSSVWLWGLIMPLATTTFRIS